VGKVLAQQAGPAVAHDGRETVTLPSHLLPARPERVSCVIRT
jgi:hypothetical protein